MNRIRIALLALVILGTLALVGCKDGEAPSELEAFIASTAHLDGEALEDTLRSLEAADPPRGTYAGFLLGNLYYDRAGEVAAAKGWNDAAAGVLLDSAEVHFAGALARDSTFVEALVNLGSVWDDRSEMLGSRDEREQRLAQAESFYRAALAQQPTDDKARCNLGGLYLRQRKTAQALAEFEAALEHNPRSALAHYNIAIMFAEQKIYREAIREWEMAAKYDPDGDIGQRSRDNVRIVRDLMNAPDPGSLGK